MYPSVPLRGTSLSNPRPPLPVCVAASGRDAAVSEQRYLWDYASHSRVRRARGPDSRPHRVHRAEEKIGLNGETFIVFANPVRTLKKPAFV